MKDVAIIGGGLAGMATAARLQAQGYSTVILEAHATPGGCAGYFRRHGFSFDVGATTLVDFQPGGLGAEFLESIGMDPLRGEALPGYVAWLPDRQVTLHRDHDAWAAERRRCFGDTIQSRRFWSLLDRIADVFWTASRRGVRLPICTPEDICRAINAVGFHNLPLTKYLFWTMGDALRAHDLRGDDALVGLLSALIEDTVHSTTDNAPLINAALGITIRGAGLTRAHGGMRGFWQALTRHYESLGGELKVDHAVADIIRIQGSFRLATKRGDYEARQVVSALPASLTAQIAPAQVGRALAPYLRRDHAAVGGAVIVFLGVPEEQVACQTFTHHQIMQDYSGQLGNGNNMFISVSAPGDVQSAPDGFRSVMISTHCDIAPWQGLSSQDYDMKKREIGDRLVRFARRVYPDLGCPAVVYEVGTPSTYARFTRRPLGAVGGTRLDLSNANQNAVPHDIGVPGFYLAGDTTWPGLGTVACVLCSKIAADLIMQETGAKSPFCQRRQTIHGHDNRSHASHPLA